MRTKFFLMGMLFVLAGCAKNESIIGYSFPDGYEQHLKVGRTSKDDVIQLLGAPTTESSYGEKTYYYISQRQYYKAFMEPVLEDQKVLALKFNKNDVLSAASQYDLNDYKSIEHDNSKTELRGNEMGVLEQMMHNVGRFGSKKKSVGR
jgi:outer membrane protein assembly factor BamE (lipoprotein component of BamABCDE complex)